MKVCYAICHRGIEDNICDPFERTFSELAEHVSELSAEARERGVSNKLYQPALVGGHFRPGIHTKDPAQWRGLARWRLKSLCVQMGLLMLDFDGVPFSLDDIASVWGDVAAISWGSYSNGAPDKPGLCVRYVMPYARPVSPEEHRLIYQWALEHMLTLGLKAPHGKVYPADTACKDVTRIMFLPAIYHPRGVMLPLELRAGAPLDPDNLPGGCSVARLVQAEAEAIRLRGQAGRLELGQLDARAAAYVRAAVEGQVEAVVGAPKGEGHKTLYNAAARLGNFIPGGYLGEAAIHDQLAAACAQRGSSKTPKEIARVVRDGIRAGITTPIDLAEVLGPAPAAAPPRRSMAPVSAPSQPSPVTAGAGSGDGGEPPDGPLDGDAPGAPSPGEGSDEESVVVRLAFRSQVWDAPVPDEALVPPGYLVSNNGVWLLKESKREGEEPVRVPVSSDPVVVSGVLEDAETKEVSLRVDWKRTKRWSSVISHRDNFKTRAKIISLARLGMAADDTNARNLIQYLSAYEALNDAIIPRATLTSSTGWLDGGPHFMWGRHQIHADQQALINLDSMPPTDWHEGMVAFRAGDGGVDELIRGMRSRGTYQGWLNTIALLAPYPRAKVVFYASFAAPLLWILRANNFVLDISGESSHGKTVATYGAASVWGNPQTNQPDSIIHSWGGTRTFFTRAPAAMRDMPFFLDDTKARRSDGIVTQTIYDFANGKASGRATVEGVQKTPTVRSVLISTGEMGLVNFSKDYGIRGRVLSLWGPPFGAERNAALVEAFEQGCFDNYGHAGWRFIRYLQSQHAHWPAMRERYRALKQQLATRLKGQPLVERLAGALALLEASAKLAHEALELPFPYDDCVREAFSQVASELTDTDMPLEALRFAVEWAIANEHRFIGQSKADRNPHGGWAGRWDENTTVVMYFPSELEALLRSVGHEPDAVLRIWKERGWIDTDNDRSRRTKRLRVKDPVGNAKGGPRTYLYVINDAGFAAATA